MTGAQISRRIARVMNDLDELSEEFNLRGDMKASQELERDHARINRIALRWCDGADISGIRTFDYTGSERTPPALQAPEAEEPEELKEPKTESAAWLETLSRLDDTRET
jgi:hypothetical protein